MVELRQYTLRPGRRDDLVTVFDGELVETQEALGGYVLGQFLDLGHDDRFVWLRGFTDLGSRLRMLTAFYGGPVWAEHGPAANETMLDSDDVLLLEPVRLGDPWPTTAGRCASAAVRPVRRGGCCTTTVPCRTPSSRSSPPAGRTPSRRQGPSRSRCCAPSTSSTTSRGCRCAPSTWWCCWRGRRSRSPHRAPRGWREARAPQRLRLAPTARSALR